MTTASTDQDLQPRDTIALLKASGIRLTSPRRAVLAALDAVPGHPTVEQIAAAMPYADLSSLYRNLDLLAKVGAVQQVQPARGPATYHLLRGEPAHPHAQCTDCGALFDLPVDLLARTAAELRHCLDFTLDPGDVTLAGRCDHCAEITADAASK